MGFETRVLHKRKYRRMIWTLSLWDLKQDWFWLHQHFKIDLNFVPMGFETGWYRKNRRERTYLNFVPMGFETLMLKLWLNWKFHLNFVPMGFETPWKFLLHYLFQPFELCPYGIWNYPHCFYHLQVDLYLNFVPMGFETTKLLGFFKSSPFELCPYGIWNWGC